MLPLVTIADASDGSNQALRTALGLSLLTLKPLRLFEPQDDHPRFRPGLGSASLNLMAALARISSGNFQGVVAEDQASFSPKTLRPIDAGYNLSELRFSECPIAWILETAVPALNRLSEPSNLIITGGGTHVWGGPTTEEIQHLWLPLWSMTGMSVNYLEIVPGFHPEANGEAEISISPMLLPTPLNLDEPFQPTHFYLDSCIAGLPIYIAEQTIETTLARLQDNQISNVSANIRQAKGSQGHSILVRASNGKWSVGFSALGRKGQRPETMANETVETLLNFLQTKAAITAQQAIWSVLPLLYAQGNSVLLVDRLSSPLLAAIRTINHFFPNAVVIEETMDKTWKIKIQPLLNTN